MPQSIVTFGLIEPYAQYVGSDGSSKVVCPNMPSIKRWLERLAEKGLGCAEVYKDVRYKFTKRMLPGSVGVGTGA